MKVVVVGGGFAGVKAALELSKRGVGPVTLISDTTYFLYHAVLYATVTGKSYAESVVPLAEIFERTTNVTVVQDTLTSIDPSRKTVSCTKKNYSYDKLVLALGSVNNYFNIPGVEQHSYSMRTLDRVVEFHDHIMKDVYDGRLDKQYVIVGAGPTGVELAGSLKVYLDRLSMIHHIKHPNVRVTLVEASPRVLSTGSKTGSRKVLDRLRSMGVTVHLNHRVEKLSDDFVVIDGKQVHTKTAVWTSGVANNPFFSRLPEYFKLDRRGKVEVNSYLEAYRDIYVLGDNNNVAYSGMAWPALDHARFVAKHLARLKRSRPVRRFRPHQPPSGTPIGSAWAYVEWHGVYASGYTGYLIRRWMELYGLMAILPWHHAITAWRSHSTPEVDVDKATT